MPETTKETRAKSLTQALRTVPVLQDLTGDQIWWLASHSREMHAAAGEVILREGDPADSMFFIFEGEIRFQRESAGQDAPVAVAGAGQIGGKLPYSRMTHYVGTVRAVTPLWGASIAEIHFREMLQVIPALGQRLVGIMSDRIREATKSEQQRDKLTSLGKLSAGLAHEINNPASAAKRAAASLRETLDTLRQASARLDQQALTYQDRAFITELEARARQRLENAPKLDPLEASDREEELGTWLEEHGVANGWELAPLMAESGVPTEVLDRLSSQLAPGSLGDVLTRVSATVASDKLVSEIQHSISRITDLVCAIKEYSYMDQAPEQEVDLHDGLESTLTIMAYKLRKNNVEVVRNYDRSLPRVCAFGRELNQVWTNLIDNAADAMKDGGQLRISTAPDRSGVVVDIEDTGAGIAPEIQHRIFEAFFTTKPVGEGTGLGLDTVSRIVRKHRGNVKVDSQPGETHVRVHLPAVGLKNTERKLL